MDKPIQVGEEYKNEKNGRWYATHKCPICHKHWDCKVYDVQSGNTTKCKSCSCRISATTHGRRFDKEYTTWLNMHQRCSNPSASNYEYYGARGITVCTRWKHFESFIEDMKKCPSGMELDRIDNDKGYYLENCKWSTKEEQMKNRSNNVNLTDNSGVEKPLLEWAKIKDTPASTMYSRWSRGWSEHEIIHGK